MATRGPDAWPGKGIVEGMGTTCFTLSTVEKKERNLLVACRKVGVLPRESSEPKPYATAPPMQSCSVGHSPDHWGFGGGRCRDPTEMPNRHCRQGICLTHIWHTVGCVNYMENEWKSQSIKSEKNIYLMNPCVCHVPVIILSVLHTHLP